MMTLVDDLVPDGLWALVAPLLPAPRPPYGGRHRAIPDRNCFAAIVYMARTSTPWRLLPARGARLRLANDLLAAADRVGEGGSV
jgi:transposase